MSRRDAGASEAFHDVAGLIEITPAKRVGQRRRRAARALLPGPRPLSDVSTSIGRLRGTNPSTIATVTKKRAGSPAMRISNAWASWTRESAAMTRSDGRRR